MDTDDRGIIYIWDHEFAPTRMNLAALLRELKIPDEQYLTSQRRGRFFLLLALPGLSDTYCWSATDEAALEEGLRSRIEQLKSIGQQVPRINTSCAPLIADVVDRLLESLGDK